MQTILLVGFIEFVVAEEDCKRENTQVLRLPLPFNLLCNFARTRLCTRTHEANLRPKMDQEVLRSSLSRFYYHTLEGVEEYSCLRLNRHCARNTPQAYSNYTTSSTGFA